MECPIEFRIDCRLQHLSSHGQRLVVCALECVRELASVLYGRDSHGWGDLSILCNNGRLLRNRKHPVEHGDSDRSIKLNLETKNRSRIRRHLLIRLQFGYRCRASKIRSPDLNSSLGERRNAPIRWKKIRYGKEITPFVGSPTAAISFDLLR